MHPSILVDPDEVNNFLSANGTLFQVLAALDTRSVVLARHVYAVLIRVTTNDTGVRVSLVTD